MHPVIAPRSAAKLLSGVLGALRWILIVATPVVLVLGVIALLGVGSATVAGETEQVRPVTLEPGEYQIVVDGVPVDVAETTTFESDDGTVSFGTTDVTIRVGDNAFATRLAVVALFLSWLAMAWVAVGNLRAVTRSTLEGDAFTASNCRRLRRVGIAALAYPVITFLGHAAIRYSVGKLDLAGPSVVADLGVPGWLIWVVAGLFFLVVAEVYTHGVELRELDDTTV